MITSHTLLLSRMILNINKAVQASQTGSRYMSSDQFHKLVRTRTPTSPNNKNILAGYYGICRMALSRHLYLRVLSPPIPSVLSEPSKPSSAAPTWEQSSGQKYCVLSCAAIWRSQGWMTRLPKSSPSTHSVALVLPSFATKRRDHLKRLCGTVAGLSLTSQEIMY
mgnify:CR=1 FL=1